MRAEAQAFQDIVVEGFREQGIKWGDRVKVYLKDGSQYEGILPPVWRGGDYRLVLADTEDPKQTKIAADIYLPDIEHIEKIGE